MRRRLALSVAGALTVTGAALAYGRVFSDGAWTGPVLVAITLATALAAAAQELRIHSAISAGLSAVGLFVTSYVLLLDGGPLLPGLEQLRGLVDLGVEGLDLLYGQLAPVPADDSLILLLVVGAWAVAHGTHEVIARTNVGAVGLALPAALWTVAVAIPVPDASVAASTVPFLLGAVIHLLVTSDHDVVGWATDRQGPRVSGLGAAIGGVATMAAVVLPLTILGHGAEPWLDLTGGTNPRGYQPIVDVGDRLKLPAPRDVLTVRAAEPAYLRIAALETFDGTSWRIGPASERSFRPRTEDLFDATQALPPEVPISGRRVDFSVDVEVLELENIYVPVPYQPMILGGPAADEMVYSRIGGFVATADVVEPDPDAEAELKIGVTPGVAYSVDGSTPRPTYEELIGATWTDQDLAGRTELPRDYPALAQTARDVWDAAGATATIDRVLVLQDWFIGPGSPFTYSTDVPDLRGEDALHRFVLETQVGYCEYFATAMAVMLRTADIPARVSVGFLPGTPNASASGGDVREWTVSTEDAHAWVEVLFPDVGWVKFDPTPRGDGATYVPTESDLTPRLNQAQLGLLGQQPPGEEPTDSTTTPGGGPTAVPTDSRNFADELVELPGEAGAGIPLWVLVLTGVVLAGVAVVLFAWWTDRRPNATDPVGRVVVAQGRLHDEARRLGTPRHHAETGHETAARFAREGRGSPETLWRLADLSAAAAFGRRATDDDAHEAEHLSHLAIKQLRSTATRSERILRPLRRPSELLHDGWLRAWTTLGRAWTRRPR